ncbi:MAG: GrpB family protein [Acidobacteriota bacterium]
MTKQRKVEIVEYNPQWPEYFSQLSSTISSAIGELALWIEHVGSTSIPGLAAKPIIDLDIVIASRQPLPEIVQRLVLLGYQHEGDLGVLGREAFAREGEDVPRDATGRKWPAHHLYVCAQDNAELAKHITFRDYLRNNRAAVLAYQELKYQLAQQFPYDVDAYCEAKTNFINNILQQAKT